jgi:nucleoid DNA-binding protein
MSEKITFKELVTLIAEQSQQSQSSTNNFIGELVNVIENGLRETGSVSISGFGKFELRWMKERQGRNPQTGEPITVPGQNKVYFKPFKALREDVNRTYSNMEAKVLDESSESGTESLDEDKDEPADKTPEKATEKEEAIELETPASGKAAIQLAPPEEPEEENDGDHLLIERPLPTQSEAENDVDEIFLTVESEESDNSEQPESSGESKPFIPDRKSEIIPESLFSIPEPSEPEEKKIKKPLKSPVPVSTASSGEIEKTKKAEKASKKSFNFRWLDIVAIVVLILSAAALYFLLRQDPGSETPQQAVTEQPPQEQVISPSETETEQAEPSSEEEEASETEPSGEEPGIQTESGTETEEQEPAVSSAPESAFTTAPYRVQRGESLWSIAESNMGDPYLWPAIFNLNTGVTTNPNRIPANGQLSVPSVSDPDNLRTDQLREVAMGYLSVYDWAADNQPEYARFYLWAVGVYSADVLEQAENRVSPDDWQFAINR